MNSFAVSSAHNRPKRNGNERAPQFPRDAPAYLSGRALQSLRKITDDPTAFPEFIEKRQHHRDAADLAVFAYNASLNTGPLENDQFHPAFLEFRKNTKDAAERSRIILRMRRAVQDHAALLDQVTGGTTLVVSIPGALEHNTPAAPEYIKAFSYFPGSILRELQAADDADTIDDIVQVIIRKLGVPTVKRFERALKKTWSHLANTKASGTAARPLPEIKGIPQPIPDSSSRYLFYGRAMAENSFPDMRYIERYLPRRSEEIFESEAGNASTDRSYGRDVDAEESEMATMDTETIGSQGRSDIGEAHGRGEGEWPGTKQLNYYL